MGIAISLPEPFSNYPIWSLNKANKVMRQFEEDDVEFGIDLDGMLNLTNLGADEEQSSRIISCFDNNRSGIINILDFICGLLVLCDGPADEKISALFDCYDFNRSSSISLAELTILMASCTRGVHVMTQQGSEPSEDELEALAKVAFKETGSDVMTGGISKSSFTKWAKEYLSTEFNRGKELLKIMMVQFRLVQPEVKEELKDVEHIFEDPKEEEHTAEDTKEIEVDEDTHAEETEVEKPKKEEPKVEVEMNEEAHKLE